MGFYLRKGINFGPLRLNLSRSGLGASFGVKGARIGIGPRGSYIHMGRGGLYYRQTLASPHAALTPAQPASEQPKPTALDNQQEIKSSPATTLTDSSATELLKELNRVKKRTDRFPVVIILGGIAVIWMFSVGAAWWASLLMILAMGVLAAYARNSDVLNGTAILNYSLGPDAENKYSKLQAPFRQLAQCEKVWHIDATGHNADIKRHAGAGVSMERKETRPKFSKPSKVQCNIDVPVLQTKDLTLYFFPDRLLVYDSAGVGSVAYGDLEVEGGENRFVENESVPRDSRQLDKTWRYVNKKGGPDRRFANNREFPIMQYGLIGFSSSQGLKAIFMCSRGEIASKFVPAFSDAKTPVG
jgi:Protein of unknown function (DUF4236)